jgi:hypothetical protein
MLQPQRESDDGWMESDSLPASGPARQGSSAYGPATDLEPGWRAIRALMQLRSDELLAVMMRPSFRPVREIDLVSVAPCTYCHDGGMRTAGTVRMRRGRVTVHACDTCGTVDIGEQLAGA